MPRQDLKGVTSIPNSRKRVGGPNLCRDFPRGALPHLRCGSRVPLIHKTSQGAPGHHSTNPDVFSQALNKNPTESAINIPLPTHMPWIKNSWGLHQSLAKQNLRHYPPRAAPGAAQPGEIWAKLAGGLARRQCLGPTEGLNLSKETLKDTS